MKFHVLHVKVTITQDGWLCVCHEIPTFKLVVGELENVDRRFKQEYGITLKNGDVVEYEFTVSF